MNSLNYSGNRRKFSYQIFIAHIENFQFIFRKIFHVASKESVSINHLLIYQLMKFSFEYKYLHEKLLNVFGLFILKRLPALQDTILPIISKKLI